MAGIFWREAQNYDCRLLAIRPSNSTIHCSTSFLVSIIICIVTLFICVLAEFIIYIVEYKEKLMMVAGGGGGGVQWHTNLVRVAAILFALLII